MLRKRPAGGARSCAARRRSDVTEGTYPDFGDRGSKARDRGRDSATLT